MESDSFQTATFTFLDYVDMDDEMSRMVWECRNLPEIREWMVNPDFIAYENHVKFVKGLKSKSHVKYFVVLQNGEFIGSVNLHLNVDGTAERGIYIHPSKWGKGYAKGICNDFYKYAKSVLGVSSITTKVFKDNAGSNSLENSLGARIDSEDERFFYYTCDLSLYV